MNEKCLCAFCIFAYMAFFLTAFFRIRRSVGIKCGDTLLSGLPKVGEVLMIMFLVDQIKVEFLRFDLSDYHHYVFFLIGSLLAFSEKLREKFSISSISKESTPKGRGLGCSPEGSQASVSLGTIGMMGTQ